MQAAPTPASETTSEVIGRSRFEINGAWLHLNQRSTDTASIRQVSPSVAAIDSHESLDHTIVKRCNWFSCFVPKIKNWPGDATTKDTSHLPEMTVLDNLPPEDFVKYDVGLLHGSLVRPSGDGSYTMLERAVVDKTRLAPPQSIHEIRRGQTS